MSEQAKHEPFADYTDDGYEGACHECPWRGPLHPLGAEGKALAWRDALAHTVEVPGFVRVRDGKEHWVPGYVRNRPRPKWTREAIVAALKQWTELYGDPPGTVDWNPALCRIRGNPTRSARYLNGIWPATATVVRRFGSWTAALGEAGLEARISGPRSDLGTSPTKLSRRNLSRLRAMQGREARVGLAEFKEAAKRVLVTEKEGEPELLQDALLDLAAIAVAWADRAER